MRKIISSLVIFLCIAYSLSAQSPYEMYCGEWRGGWKVGKVTDDDKVLEYQLFHEGESKSNWTERAGLTTYKTFYSLNVEQIMEQLLSEMKPKYEKAKFTMVDKNVYGDTPYVIYLIETENFNHTGKPQALIQHIVKGPEFTHIAYFMTKESKMSGSDKRQWESFFKSVKLETVNPSNFLANSGILP
jgi:hypothetical protein